MEKKKQKLVDLKKIKDHSGVDIQKKSGMGDNDNLVEYYKNNRYRKLNNTYEKSKEETRIGKILKKSMFLIIKLYIKIH